MTLRRATAVLTIAVACSGLAFSTPATATNSTNSADRAVQSDLRYIANEMETYFTDHQKYPGSRAITVSGRLVAIGSEPVRLSKSNRLGTIRLTKDRWAFCVRVVRKADASATTRRWSYVSDKGGIMRGGCPARFSKVSA